MPRTTFIGVEHTDEESFLKMIDLAKIFLAEEVMPPISHYSEKNGRYFADLAKNIPTILVEEVKYFESVGAYVPIEPGPHSRHVSDPKEYKMSAHGRTTPQRMYAGAVSAILGFFISFKKISDSIARKLKVDEFANPIKMAIISSCRRYNYDALVLLYLYCKECGIYACISPRVFKQPACGLHNCFLCRTSSW